MIVGDGLKEQKSLGRNNYVELCLVDPDFCLRLSYRLSLPLEERWVSHTEPEMKVLLLQGCIGILAGKSLWAGTKGTARLLPAPEPQAPAGCFSVGLTAFLVCQNEGRLWPRLTHLSVRTAGEEGDRQRGQHGPLARQSLVPDG